MKNIDLVSEPIFLVGAERSGTTVLRLMLDHHPKIAWCSEFEYAVDIGGKWCGVTGQITEKENVVRELDYKQNFRRFALSPTRIDINSLRMALEYLKVE